MKKLLLIAVILLFTGRLLAQTEPSAGSWKTWFITSGKDYRLPPPSSYKDEIAQVISTQKNLDSAGLAQIIYWNAGAPGYRWYNMMTQLWTVDTSRYGALANLLLGTAIYDATIAGWSAKYVYGRPRPFVADRRIKLYAPKAESPSYPCEYSIAAGVAATIISHFYPYLADSVNRMVQQQMQSRIAAGLAFPDDARAGFELGKKIAEKEIEYTRDFVNKNPWDGKVPQGPAFWKGKYAMLPMAGKNKTVVLDSASQLRPGPPPDFAKDMAEMKNFKRTFSSNANAFFWASQDFWFGALSKKIFEYNLQSDPPRASRLYAITAVGAYDCFVACWDAKYTYWGIRPNQYDTTYKSLVPAPPFPGYPSGHAAISGVMAELYSYFFPAERSYFQNKASEGAESRFQAGIHFRTDNEVALELGKKVAALIIQKVTTDGADDQLTLLKQKK